VFIPKLETIFQKILDQILFIDVKDLYNLKVDPEEYYTSIEEGNDEDVYLRVRRSSK